MEEYQSNSILKTDSEEKKVRRVISGKVSQRKTPILDKVINGDTTKAIFDYIVWDILVPAFKNTLSDIVTNGMDMALFGESSSRSRRSNRLQRSKDRTYVSYSEYYDRDRQPRSGRLDRESVISRPNSRHRFEDVVFDTRADAEEVLSTLAELIDQYDFATVADFFDASGLESKYTDRNYGWDKLDSGFVRPIRGGFVLDLPKPLLIN